MRFGTRAELGACFKVPPNPENFVGFLWAAQPLLWRNGRHSHNNPHFMKLPGLDPSAAPPTTTAPHGSRACRSRTARAAIPADAGTQRSTPLGTTSVPPGTHPARLQQRPFLLTAVNPLPSRRRRRGSTASTPPLRRSWAEPPQAPGGLRRVHAPPPAVAVAMVTTLKRFDPGAVRSRPQGPAPGRRRPPQGSAP